MRTEGKTIKKAEELSDGGPVAQAGTEGVTQALSDPMGIPPRLSMSGSKPAMLLIFEFLLFGRVKLFGRKFFSALHVSA